MAYKIIWSPRAASNLEEITSHIAKDSDYYAVLFAKKIIALIEAIPQFPKAGRVVPEYKDENIREKIYENYRIVYRLKGNTIEIGAILHGSKQLGNIP
ncbi:MAG: type II toxin-antitoxin system RelE/ParE family toxin [Nitrospirae bacterium]|nr:type II toxin-antitoxin system RelE/ParE family toxin [Nitrospirota bacterium]